MLREIGKMLVEFNTCSAVFRIVLDAAAGGCIGFERGQHGRAAGLRTHILVCVGAAITVLCGLYAALEIGFSNDPMRVSAQVISGIGFLGAGTILTRNSSQVTGLTTAAGLWATACIGVTIGVGFYWAALTAFLIVWISISLLTRLEWGQKRNSANTYYLEVSDARYVNGLCDAIVEHGGHLQILSAKSGIASHVGLIYVVPEHENNAMMLEWVRAAEGVIIAVPLL